jgi:hypothetical protein
VIGVAQTDLDADGMRAPVADQTAQLAWPTADQERVCQRREPITVVAFEQSQCCKRIEQDSRPALVGTDGHRDRAFLVLPGGNLIEHAQLQPCLQYRCHFETLGHL